MHYHLELIYPPNLGMTAEEVVSKALAPYCEHDETNKHAFWDYHTIGGRWSGSKRQARIGKERLDAFWAWLQEANVTVSGLQFGKQELSPADQIPLVDAKWQEITGDDGPCPHFKHSGSTDKGDVCNVSDLPADFTASVVFVWNGGKYGNTLLFESVWNGETHQRTAWDLKVASAIAQHNKDHKAQVSDDWACVTVDYHS